MKTIILPGFSLKNKDWALAVKKHLPNKQIEINFWPHWEENHKASENWIKAEAEKIINKSKSNGIEFNILAKSVGTLVAMNTLKTPNVKINKLILCGIPVNDLEEDDFEYYKVLSNFPDNKLLIIQNRDDNHGSSRELESMLKKLNIDKNITVKQRNDHEYPYFKEFSDFI